MIGLGGRVKDRLARGKGRIVEEREKGKKGMNLNGVATFDRWTKHK